MLIVPQAAMKSRHWPGTAPGPAGERPPPPTAYPIPDMQVKVFAREKTKGWIETRELGLPAPEWDFPGINIPSLVTIDFHKVLIVYSLQSPAWW